MNTDKLIKIGDLAKQAGVSVDTVRFYESKHLISATHRSDSGYRLFSHGELGKLLFIQRAKTVGFTLSEIAELMELRLHPNSHTCAEVKLVTEQKLQQVNSKIAELKRIQRSLQQMSAACDGGERSAEECTILQLLDSEEIA